MVRTDTSSVSASSLAVHAPAGLEQQQQGDQTTRAPIEDIPFP